MSPSTRSCTVGECSKHVDDKRIKGVSERGHDMNALREAVDTRILNEVSYGTMFNHDTLGLASTTAHEPGRGQRCGKIYRQRDIHHVHKA